MYHQCNNCISTYPRRVTMALINLSSFKTQNQCIMLQVDVDETEFLVAVTSSDVSVISLYRSCITRTLPFTKIKTYVHNCFVIAICRTVTLSLQYAVFSSQNTVKCVRDINHEYLIYYSGNRTVDTRCWHTVQ